MTAISSTRHRWRIAESTATSALDHRVCGRAPAIRRARAVGCGDSRGEPGWSELKMPDMTAKKTARPPAAPARLSKPAPLRSYRERARTGRLKAEMEGDR